MTRPAARAMAALLAAAALSAPVAAAASPAPASAPSPPPRPLADPAPGPGGAAAPATVQAALAGLGIDIDQTSVSGVSSGGAMAVQMHVAHSSIMRGVGVTAGIAYDCADSDARLDDKRLANMIRCMKGEVPPTESKAKSEEAARDGKIDPLDNLAGQRIWLLHGANDHKVEGTAMQAVETYYRYYVDDADVFMKILPRAAHAQITDRFGAECPAAGEFYISDCDYDSAGALLEFIYDDGTGGFEPRNEGTLSGEIRAFPQVPFVGGKPKPYGLADTGYVYVPAACDDADAAPCRVHVVFHGCKQSAGNVGNAFYVHAGYNEWADTNRIVVLYPQTQDIPVLGLINMTDLDAGCWDWFGYAGYDVTGRYDRNYARKGGFQISAIRRMLDCLAEPHGTAC